jgi:hypothetical protein
MKFLDNVNHFIQYILLQKILKLCTGMLHTEPTTTKHVHRHCLRGHRSDVDIDGGCVGFQFIQTVWDIAVGTVLNVAP